MKELRYLNKYLLKYKWLLIWGTIFVIISNVFKIIPGPLVRESIEYVVDNLPMHGAFNGSDLQPGFFNVFAFGILI